MIAFRYGDYFCLNDIEKKTKSYHEIFIHNICPDIKIMIPSITLRNNLINMSRMYVGNIIIP